MFMETVIYALVGLFVGSLSGWLFYRYWTRSLIKNAKSEAEEIVDEVKEALEIKQIEQNERLNEIEMEMWTKAEPELLKFENRITDLEERLEEKKRSISNSLESSQIRK